MKTAVFSCWLSRRIALYKLPNVIFWGSLIVSTVCVSVFYEQYRITIKYVWFKGDASCMSDFTRFLNMVSQDFCHTLWNWYVFYKQVYSGVSVTMWQNWLNFWTWTNLFVYSCIQIHVFITCEWQLGINGEMWYLLSFISS